MTEKMYSVYIATNQKNTVLYTGVTSNIYKRKFEHQQGKGSAFTSKYKVNKIVFVESFRTPLEAIAAEKKIKGWVRKKKIALVEEKNQRWDDLLELEPDSSLRSE